MSRRHSIRSLGVAVLAVAGLSTACTDPTPQPNPTPPRTGTVVRLATGGAITEAVISRNAWYVAYVSTATTPGTDGNGGATDVFLIDRQTSTTARVSGGNGASDSPSVADDGSVVFRSASTDLAGADANAHVDVFRWASATTSRITDSPGDVTAPLVSADGTTVVFGAPAALTMPGGTTTTLAYRWMLASPGPTPIAAGGPDGAVPVSVSRDGSRVLLAEPGRLSLWESATGTALLVAAPATPAAVPKVTTFSVAPHAVADDGDVVFGTLSYNYAPVTGAVVFISGTVRRWDRQTTTLSSVGVNGLAAGPVQSADGRHLLSVDLKGVSLDQDTPPAFLSGAIRSYDRTAGASISVATAAKSSLGTVSADGRYVAFVSTDATLVVPDANAAGADVYLWDRGA